MSFYTVRNTNILIFEARLTCYHKLIFILKNY